MELSIILPAYNSEDYILETLDSFVPDLKDKQELIIVNDCSTDKTLKIIKKYISQNRSKNITLINNEKNSGAGNSKNKALSIAKGKYIGFIDSDDIVDKDYFNLMLLIAKKHNCDLVTSDIVFRYPDRYKYMYIDDSYCFSKKAHHIIREKLLWHPAVASACTKLFNKKLIGDYKFMENRCDDLTFCFPIVGKAESIVYLPNNNYYYRQTNDSLARKKNLEYYFDNLDSIFFTINILIKKNMTDVLIAFICNTYIPFVFYNLLDENEKTRKNVFNYISSISKNVSIKKYLVEEMFIKKVGYKKMFDVAEKIIDKDFKNLIKYGRTI